MSKQQTDKDPAVRPATGIRGMPFVSVAVCWTHTSTHIHLPPPPSLPLVTKHTVLNIHTNKRYCYARFLQGETCRWETGIRWIINDKKMPTIILNRMRLSRTVLFAQGCPLFVCEKLLKVWNMLWVLANGSTNISVYSALFIKSFWHSTVFWSSEALI